MMKPGENKPQPPQPPKPIQPGTPPEALPWARDCGE